MVQTNGGRWPIARARRSPVPRPIDLIGRTVDKLIVQSRGDTDHLGCRLWHCLCQCGAEVTAKTHDLTSARVFACPACGGPTPKPPRPCNCAVCGQPFLGHGNLCSWDCVLARRRGLKVGVEHLPPPVVPC